MQINIFSPLSNQSHLFDQLRAYEALYYAFEKVPCPSLTGRAHCYLFSFFHVITLTFSSGRKKNAFDYRLTRVCVRACVHAVMAAC